MTGNLHVKNRSIRTAFLVDLDVHHPHSLATEAIINAIVDHATEMWGGRLNSLHFYHGSLGLTEEDWDEMAYADPDRLYAFAPLSDDLVRKLQALHPWTIQVHDDGIGLPPSSAGREGEESWNRLTLRLSGVMVPPSRENLLKISAENLILFGYAENCPDSVRHFLHRNFGGYYQWIDSNRNNEIRRIGWLEELKRVIPHQEIRLEGIADFASLVDQLAGRLGPKEVRAAMGFIAPAQASSLHSPGVSYRYLDRGDMKIFIGSRPEMFGCYWNDCRTSGNWKRPVERSFWIPLELLQEPSVAQHFQTLVWHYARWHSGNRIQVECVHEAADQAAVASIVEAFKQTPHSVHMSMRERGQWTAERRKRIKRDADRTYLRPWLISSNSTRFRLHETSQTLTLPVPAAVHSSSDAEWALEMQMETDHMPGIGRSPNYWFLPRDKAELLSISMFKKITRINADHQFVAHIEHRTRLNANASPPDLQVHLIAESHLIPALFFDRGQRFERDDVRSIQLPLEKLITHVAVSEAGRHLAGAISLFEDLNEAERFCDRRFWVDTFARMAGQKPGDNQTLSEIIRNTLGKELKRMQVPDAAEKAQRLTDRLLKKVAAKFHDRPLTYAELQHELAKVNANPPAPIIEYPAGNTQVSLQGSRPITENELKKDLQFLVGRNILHPGTMSTCPNCGADQWYSASEVGQKLTCSGCNETYSINFAPEWSYRLNSAAQRALASNSLHVLRAIAEIASHSRWGFFYSPSLDLFTPGQDKNWKEVDLVCISDGELIVGEVKSGEPLRSEITEFTEKVLRLKPQRAAIFVELQHQQHVKPWIADMQRELAPHGIKAELHAIPIY
jgi:hypothetical protein